MKKIAIIDDNKDQRNTLGRAMRYYLKRLGSSLIVIDIFPFKKYAEYFPWIEDNSICVLIFDERLHDNADNGKEPVGYRGNELVTKIRSKYKDIPIFTITSHADDDDLQDKFGEFEYIIGREEFINDGEKFVSIIMRASQRYLDENERELKEFGELTKRAAAGTIKPSQLSRLRALQTKLNISLSNDLADRNEWLEEYEKHIKELGEVGKLISKKIKRKAK